MDRERDSGRFALFFFSNIRLFLYSSCFTVWWSFCFMFFFFYVRDRSDSYLDSFELWVASSFFGKIFLPFTFLPIIPIFIRKAKKTGTGRRPFVFCLLCLMFVFTTVRKKKAISYIWGVGYWLVGHGFGLGFHF